jgi:hypothetical protein
VLADRVAQRMLDVLVRHSMSARWLTNPRLDKLACLAAICQHFLSARCGRVGPSLSPL